MKVGFLGVVNEYSVDPASLARKAEELGFESAWVPDHAIIPVHTSTPLPESQPGQGQIPEIYSHMCDPFVAMSMMAAVTTKLKLGTGVCLVPERHPLVTANEIATLDAFSEGRVLFGIGAGWLKEESEILGGDFPHRWSQTREYIQAMRELWTKDQVSFEGKYVNFPPVKLYPKPASKDGPPVLIGSKDRNALRWVARWGDGWCPIFYSPAEMRTHLGSFRPDADWRPARSSIVCA
jgi:probable F420-dependent oxidoreductase